MLRIPSILVACFLATALAFPLPAGDAAQQASEAFLGSENGDSLFKTYCASCHGASAKGDGPLADSLRFHPPDLTLLAKRNGGRFQARQVFRMIDGRDPPEGHGGPDMPVWGDAFKRSSERHSEKAVGARIRAIVDFLESIQVK